MNSGNKKQRLIFRRADFNDINEILEMGSNPDIVEYIPRLLATTLNETSEHLKMIEEKINSNEAINWAIMLKNDWHYRIQAY